jgi:hypothetical protein
VRRCGMERTARLLLTWDAVLRQSNNLAISRENALRARFLNVRFTW